MVKFFFLWYFVNIFTLNRKLQKKNCKKNKLFNCAALWPTSLGSSAGCLHKASFTSVFFRSRLPSVMRLQRVFHTDGCCQCEEAAFISFAFISLMTADGFRQQPKRKCASFKLESFSTVASCYLSCWVANFPWPSGEIASVEIKRTKDLVWNFLLFRYLKKQNK